MWTIQEYNKIRNWHPSLAPVNYVETTIIENAKKEGLPQLFKLDDAKLWQLVQDGCRDARLCGHNDGQVTQEYIDDASKQILVKMMSLKVQGEKK